MDTLLLAPVTWDLLLDSHGNIALASRPYAIAQDVASAAKLFQGELYYDQEKGVPYFQSLLGFGQSPLFFAAQLEAAALTVPEVVEAQCSEISYSGRTLAGSLKVIDTTGKTQNVTF